MTTRFQNLLLAAFKLYSSDDIFFLEFLSLQLLVLRILFVKLDKFLFQNLLRLYVTSGFGPHVFVVFRVAVEKILLYWLCCSRNKINNYVG